MVNEVKRMYAPRPGTGRSVFAPVDAVDVTEQRECGHRYQEGSAQTATSPLCACGMFAVGVCQRCGKPLCGVHGALHGDGFTCSVCQRYIDDEVAAREFELSAPQRELDKEQQETDDRAEALRVQKIESTRARIAALPEITSAELAGYFAGTVIETYALEPVTGVKERNLRSFPGIEVVRALRTIDTIASCTCRLHYRRPRGGTDKVEKIRGWVLVSQVSSRDD